MKLAICTCTYKRESLTKIVLEYYRNNFPDIDLTVITEDYANDPLSQKFNHAFECVRNFAVDPIKIPDAVILIGSDDLLSPNLIKYYQSHYSAHSDYVLGLQDLYFYDIATKKALHWKGLDGNYSEFPIGAGRIFSRKVLDKLDWRPYGDLSINRGLDSNSSLYMKSKGIKHKKVLMSNSGIALALKDRISLNPFDQWKLNGEEITLEPIKPFYPTLEKIHALEIDPSKFIQGTKRKARLLVTHIEGTYLGEVGTEMELEATTALGMLRNGLIEIYE